ncbi:hypothetical protein IV64_GL001131 [Lactiplantibacillus xiangfangensis]|uniref:Lipoprotein n=1 Tax=Lactiplantibacillus xiangfangensis TaxID=942150 RepID=A0A0R2MLD5_9LACO|nr:hypothetical protein IV64_GL001131 [Lactiplantibacillus xiangfangensis]
MLRTIIVVLSGWALIALTACGHTASTHPANHHDDAPTARTAPRKRVPGVTRTNFDRIQLAIEPDDYASTIEQVHALLGQPSQTNNVTTVAQRSLKTYVWKHPDTSLEGAIISVSFHDGIAVTVKVLVNTSVLGGKTAATTLAGSTASLSTAVHGLKSCSSGSAWVGPPSK